MNKSAIIFMLTSSITVFGMDCIDKTKVTTLHKLIVVNSYEAVEKMLDDHPGIGCCTGDSWNIALHVAVRYEKEKIVELLLKKRNEYFLEARTSTGDTPLLLAAMGVKDDNAPCLGIMERLITAGACVNIDSHMNHRTPLHRAVDVGSLAATRMLLMAGADRNAKPYGETALESISGGPTGKGAMYFHHYAPKYNSIRTLLKEFEGPALRDEANTVK